MTAQDLPESWLENGKYRTSGLLTSHSVCGLKLLTETSGKVKKNFVQTDLNTLRPYCKKL